MAVPSRFLALGAGRRGLLGALIGAVTGAVLMMTLVGCGSTSTSGTNLNLVNNGKLTIASDTTYAPAEYADPNNPSQYIGYDMDIARELAKRLGLQPVIVKATFSAIIGDLAGPPLGQQRYDMSISSFTINSDRQKQVDMIPYFTAGESLLIKTGSNHGLTTDFTSLCGKTIAVQNGTVEKQEIDDANGVADSSPIRGPVCAKNQIKELHFDDQTVVVQQVINGNADASYQDSPVTGYYANLNKGQVVVGPVQVAPAPEGIVVRKDNPAFETAIKNALAAMRSDGTYLKILTKWGQQDGAYPPLSGDVPRAA
ncbi:MAG TPA: ABC transporter substrate-binding protein [Ktedonobacterales bacterium]|nr:ABC transporter substrate-binding protein [Ktedonobacterales bacterium]